MCYATAQAQDARAARHLDYAILALLIPSVCLFAGVFIAAMRSSGRENKNFDLPGDGTQGTRANRLTSQTNTFPSEF